MTEDERDNLATCHVCDWRQRPCAGPCECTVDGVDIIDHAKARYCQLGFYKNNTPRPDGWSLQRIAHGAAGVAKAALGIDRAPSPEIASRRATCKACPHATTWFGILTLCELCGCGLQAKTANASESCPDTPPRWEAVEEQ